MKRILTSLFALTLSAANVNHPTGNRTTPPTLNSVNPIGIARGTTVEMTVEGLNLARASAIYFSEPGVSGKILRVKELPDLSDVRLGSNGTPSTIDLGPLPPRNQVTVEVEVSPDAEIGAVRFRLQTPLGTSPEGRFLIEPYYGESNDKEPNDSIDTAVETFLPAILTGTISKPGDVDYYKIHVNAGQQVMFLNGAAQIGSTLQPVVTIFDADEKVVKQFGASGGMDAVRFAHRFSKTGVYYVKIADYQESGKSSNFYRFIAGSFPLVASAFPLGVPTGSAHNVALKGYNVPAQISVKGAPSEGLEDAVLLRPEHSFNQLRLAVGNEPEVDAAPGATVPVPATINGRVLAKDGNVYRFRARKGAKLVVEVNARRLGSDLDSYLEVLDRDGRPIERATVRAILETSTTLSERNSTTRDIRFNSRSGFGVGDYVMIGNEIDRINTIPDSPDADVGIDSFGGQRITYFDTSGEAHSVDKPIYKVQIAAPGFSPDGNSTQSERTRGRIDSGDSHRVPHGRIRCAGGCDYRKPARRIECDARSDRARPGFDHAAAQCHAGRKACGRGSAACGGPQPIARACRESGRSAEAYLADAETRRADDRADAGSGHRAGQDRGDFRRDRAAERIRRACSGSGDESAAAREAGGYRTERRAHQRNGIAPELHHRSAA
jgi:hypothetical protein